MFTYIFKKDFQSKTVLVFQSKTVFLDLILIYFDLGIFHANQTTKCLGNLGRTTIEGWSTAT